MVFSSLSFLFAFLPCFFAVSFLLGRLWGVRGRNAALLLFSLLFYAWGEPLYVLLMVYSTLLDYSCGRMIQRAAVLGRPRAKKAWLCLSLAGNLGLLFLFKYLPLFVSTVRSLTGITLAARTLPLPIGISFYTFQTMSYSIDVYRGKIPAQRNLFRFGTYVTMFPQLIAGPIVRYEQIAGELEGRAPGTEDRAEGLRRFIRGLAKKVLIANIMAQSADGLLAYPAAQLGVLGSWLGMLVYALQLYFDFSGYSDMAIGIGRMLGFSYPENFRYPYAARSFRGYWQRWHLTMVAFFRDYVYIPLGGSRVPRGRWLFNFLLTWFLTGLWHGASWNFVLWGLFCAVLLLLERGVWGRILEKAPLLGRVWTILCILCSYVLFTHESSGEILPYFAAMFGRFGLAGSGRVNLYLLLQRCQINTVFLLSLLAGLLFSFPRAAEGIARSRKRSAAAAWLWDGVLLLLFLLCAAQLATDAYNPFIYFRF